MGIADRDYMREPPPSTARRGTAWLLLIPMGITALFLAQHALGHRGPTRIAFRPSVLPAPAITIGAPQSPYKADDPWRAWLAPESVCPGGDNASAPAAAQAQTAMCLLNYARTRQGLPALAQSGVLNSAAAAKAVDIIRCNDFSHFACGKQPDADARGYGLTDRLFGENLFWGPEIYQPPRVAVDGWLNSEHHRDNLFDPRWTQQGVAVAAAPGFRGASQSAVWVEEFSAP